MRQMRAKGHNSKVNTGNSGKTSSVSIAYLHPRKIAELEVAFRATFHLTIFMRGQRTTDKIQSNNYHHGNCGQPLTGKTSTVSLIFTHWTHRNVKNR